MSRSARRKPAAKKLNSGATAAAKTKKKPGKAKQSPKAKRSNPKAGGRVHRRKPAQGRKRRKTPRKPVKKAPAVMGRPTLYTDDLARVICAHVMAGEPLRQILLLPGMPASRDTVFEWLATHKDFSDNYARAKEIQMDAFAEELMDIADDNRNDWVQRENERTGTVKVVLNEEAIARARLRIETRKWQMSKFAAKKFGDKLAIDHGGQVRVPMTLAEFEKRVAAAEA